MTGDRVELLDQEAGNIRIQRIPRTEKRGRVHTSTVTVAVLGDQVVDLSPYRSRSERDFEVEWFGGTIGAGGQKHNKTFNCARLKHLPTGIVRTAQTRSRKNSYAEAMAAICVDLDQAMEEAARGHDNGLRKAQIGSGKRAAEKRRTFRFQEDRAIDHEAGTSAQARRVMRGQIDDLWTRR